MFYSTERPIALKKGGYMSRIDTFPRFLHRLSVNIFFSGFIMLCGYASPGNTPDTTEDVLSQLSLANLFDIKLKTGSFLELNLHNSPVSLTIITQENIQLSGARHLSEALEIFVPGFHVLENKWVSTI
jgi:hypothetical protein